MSHVTIMVIESKPSVTVRRCYLMHGIRRVSAATVSDLGNCLPYSH